MSRFWKSAIATLFVILLVASATACVDADEVRARGREGGEANQAQLAQQAQISPEQARAAALAVVPGTVQRMRLDRDNGTVVYELTVAPQGGGTASAVEVDASTGSVLKTQAVGQSQGEDEEGDDD